MPGCCGQRGNIQNSQNGNKDRCAPINTSVSSNKCVPGASPSRSRGKHVSGPHDEEVCHGTGERRRDLLDQLKIYLNEFDDKPCTVTPPQQGPNALRQLGSYPEYVKKHCQSWMPPNPRPPTITSVPVHEIRAASDFDRVKDNTSEYISYTDASPTKPIPTCDCVKRNGLQDQCPHPMCKPPTAKCRANNPGPCCPPSLGMGGPEAVLGGSKQGGSAGPPTVGARNNQAQEPLGRSEYQDAFVYGTRGNQQTQTQQSENTYVTTYRQDFQGNQQLATPTQQQPRYQQQLGAGTQHPSGMQVICICEASSPSLRSGKKYLCCPVPQ